MSELLKRLQETKTGFQSIYDNEQKALASSLYESNMEGGGKRCDEFYVKVSIGTLIRVPEDYIEKNRRTYLIRTAGRAIADEIYKEQRQLAEMALECSEIGDNSNTRMLLRQMIKTMKTGNDASLRNS